jgi:hypothetical protein
MASQFDDSDFIDRDYQGSQAGYSGTSGNAVTTAGVVNRPPTREELETRAGEAQHKLAELKRAQEELERERATLEEARRRRLEFQTGREEMLQNLTRGVTLLEQAEFTARRDAEQLGKTLGGLRESLGQIQNIHDEAWNQDNWGVELTKGLAAVENARMEWNGARLKWTLLDGPPHGAPQKNGVTPFQGPWQSASFWQLCKLGVALTWPVAIVGLIGLTLLLLRLR